MRNEKGFTLIEIIVTVTIIGLLTATVLLTLRPIDRFREAQETRARVALEAIAKAVQQYNVDNDGFYPDELDGIPTEIHTYIGDISQLNEGPWGDSYYDYDNYAGMNCTDSEADDSIQVSIRNVPYHNPDGSDNWTLYFIIEGKGTPNCTGPQWNLGECMNCERE